MQVFRLVNGGFVDRMIAFDSLPDRLLSGIRTRDISGMPRYWAKWLTDNDCVRDVFQTHTEVLADRNLRVTRTKIGKEPCFYILDYKETNTDREKWQEICNYARRVVDTKTRLMDHIEEMAVRMASNPHEQLAIEPEDIPVITIPSEVVEEKPMDEPIQSTEELITATGDAVINAPKKRGRPKKIAVEA